MSDLDKIVQMLSDDSPERRVAAAIVLGELRPKGAPVVDALAATLDSGIAVLQRRALEALARVGARRALGKILPLLAVRDDDVRRAATATLVSVGEEALPALQARRAEAGPEERRALDAVLAALGGRDAFHALLEGLAGSDGEAARAAAIAVRQRVKDADARERRSLLADTERFIAAQVKAGGSPGVVSAAVKILGYLEDERAVATLLDLARAGRQPAVRQEALIALRFAMKPVAGAAASDVVGALVDAALDADGALAQTALHTLAAMTVPKDAMRKLEKLIAHPDIERGRFVLETLGRQRGADAADVLVRVLATAKDKGRALIAAACLVEHEDGRPVAAAGSAPVREDAVAPLAAALVEATDADRAWLLRTVLRPSASKVPRPTLARMLSVGTERLGGGDRNWEPLLATARDADPEKVLGTLRALAHKLRKGDPERALTVLRVICRAEGATDDDRYTLAVAELVRGSRDTRPASRAADESLRMLASLLARGVDVGSKLRKDAALDLDDLYYVGFHFAEDEHPLGEELLKVVADKGGRTKLGKMARSKLSLGER